jgi:choline kinase
MTIEHIKHDCILLDSDIIFDHRIIGKLLNSGYKNCLAVNSSHKLGAEEIKLMTDSKNKILKIGKELDPDASIGESIGIELFDKNFFRKLSDVLERKIVTEKNVNEFYEASFQELYDAGNEMFAVNVSEFKSIEIDTPEDLTRAQEEIKFLADNGNF